MGEGLCGGVRWEMGEGLCGGVRREMGEGLCVGVRSDGRHGRERRGGREVRLCPLVMLSASLHRCWRPVGQE